MRRPRFFSPVPLSPHSSVTLDDQVARHISRVLRMNTGDELALFDGLGGEYAARIEQVSKNTVATCTAEHLNIELESPLSIELGIAVSRGDRMDWVVQKATELGVTRISPLLTERTEVKLKGERVEKKLAHWRQIAISACEQSGRNKVPEIRQISPAETWMQGVDAELKLVLHHRTDSRALSATQVQSATVLIGPEGGLSAAEIGLAEAQGFHAWALGPRVLRTETAPLAAITLMQSRWGDLP